MAQITVEKPYILIEFDDQTEVDTAALAAQIRQTLKADGTPDWRAFFDPWLRDAKNTVDQKASEMIGADPDLKAMFMGLLQAKLAPAPAPAPVPEPTPAEPTTEPTTTTEEP